MKSAKVLRRQQAEVLYTIEMTMREEDFSEFIYDEEKDLFRFLNGRFAFSRCHADNRLLEERCHWAKFQ